MPKYGDRKRWRPVNTMSWGHDSHQVTICCSSRALVPSAKAADWVFLVAFSVSPFLSCKNLKSLLRVPVPYFL